MRLQLKNISREPESEEYCAHTFDLGNRRAIFRKAKITPKKVGQFVTLWKRTQNGITQPFAFSDTFDFVIVYVKFENRKGQFIFPKAVLLQHGIISGPSKEGKRGFRIYPFWDNATNGQAMKTQQWQRNYFLEITTDTDLETAKRLYC